MGGFDTKIDVYSVRMSLISALYGIYSSEAVIGINKTLEQLGNDGIPDPLTGVVLQPGVCELAKQADQLGILYTGSGGTPDGFSSIIPLRFS
jgi:hypothetical protein